MPYKILRLPISRINSGTTQEIIDLLKQNPHEGAKLAKSTLEHVAKTAPYSMAHKELADLHAGVGPIMIAHHLRAAANYEKSASTPRVDGPNMRTLAGMHYLKARQSAKTEGIDIDTIARELGYKIDFTTKRPVVKELEAITQP